MGILLFLYSFAVRDLLLLFQRWTRRFHGSMSFPNDLVTALTVPTAVLHSPFCPVPLDYLQLLSVSLGTPLQHSFLWMCFKDSFAVNFIKKLLQNGVISFVCVSFSPTRFDFEALNREAPLYRLSSLQWIHCPDPHRRLQVPHWPFCRYPWNSLFCCQCFLASTFHSAPFKPFAEMNLNETSMNTIGKNTSFRLVISRLFRSFVNSFTLYRGLMHHSKQTLPHSLVAATNL